MFRRNNSRRSALPDEFDLQSYSFTAPIPSPPLHHHHHHHHHSQPQPQPQPSSQPFQPQTHHQQPQPSFNHPPQQHFQPQYHHNTTPQPHIHHHTYSSFFINDGYEPMDTSPDDVPFYDADSDWQPMCF